MATRNDLLARFADNTTGDIGADDGRFLVDQVFNADEAAAAATAALTTRLDATDQRVGGLASGMTIKGTVATVAALPTSGNTDGDAYIVEADGSTHIWHGSKWTQTHSTLEPRIAAVEAKTATNESTLQAHTDALETIDGNALPWLPMVTYAEGDTVYGSDKHLYVAQEAVAVGKDPVAPANRPPWTKADLGTVSERVRAVEQWRLSQLIPLTLPPVPVSVGKLRELEIGASFLLPTVTRPSAPTSGAPDIEESQIDIVGVIDRGHPVVNGIIVRTSPQTWDLLGQEWTGTPDQPSVRWQLDVDPAYPDHTAVGGAPGTSFSNVVFDLRRELGDATVFGAETIVGKIQSLEHALDAASRRIATLETAGGGPHSHVDVAAEFVLGIMNQGPHYLIIDDDPSQPDHIGIDLFDGAEHKISLKWKDGFDPTHFEEPSGSGTFLNWDGDHPAVWVQHSASFHHLVDPITGANVSYTAVKAFVSGSSVLTVKANTAPDQLEVHKVQHGTVHAGEAP